MLFYKYWKYRDKAKKEKKKPQETIHFAWKHKDILNVLYERTNVTYNVILCSPCKHQVTVTQSEDPILTS